MKQAVWILALALLGQNAVARHHHHRDSESVPGAFDYYLLSLSWSPAFCIQQPQAAECSGARRFGFIVHGLWPQNESGWPESCGGAVQVPEQVAADMSDVMPARKLIFHEWSAHGTCSGLEPAAYFALVRRAFTSIAIPTPLQGPGAAVQQAPGAIAAAFVRSNPRLTVDAVVVTCSGQDMPRLREVHICLDRALAPRACSTDALREGCRAQAVTVPPVR